MATGRRRWSRESVLQGGLLLVASTIALTASFLGVVGLVTGSVTGLTDRLPFYVLAMAIAFVLSVVFLEDKLRDGQQILQGALVLTACAFLIVTLGGEGVAYTIQRPGDVLTSHLLFYLLAAGLIGSGLGYWALNHWEDITNPRTRM